MLATDSRSCQVRDQCLQVCMGVLVPDLARAAGVVNPPVLKSVG